MHFEQNKLDSLVRVLIMLIYVFVNCWVGNIYFAPKKPHLMCNENKNEEKKNLDTRLM